MKEEIGSIGERGRPQSAGREREREGARESAGEWANESVSGVRESAC